MGQYSVTLEPGDNGITVGEMGMGQAFIADRTIYMVSSINNDGTVNVQVIGKMLETDEPVIETWESGRAIQAVLSPAVETA